MQLAERKVGGRVTDGMRTRSWHHRCATALAVGGTATLVAMLAQQGIRAAWQVRSLPERVMESLLVLVPLDLFEQGLQRFGANAKDLALLGTVVGMVALLIIVGSFAVRRGMSGWQMLAVGLGLWLFAMVMVMPLTGAGLFGTGLLVDPVLTNAAYLCVFGAYSLVLVLGTWLLNELSAPRPATNRDRRALLAGLVGGLATIGAYGLARASVASGGTTQSTLPLAAAPTLAASPTDVPTAMPTAAAQAATGGGLAATQVPASTATTVPTPGPSPYPTPASSRSVARDQEGSLTAAGRPAGILAPAITSNQDFYIVTKNAVADPVLDANTWRLVIDGEVNHPVQVDYATLRALPVVEITKTLECISNLTAGCSLAGFGCDLISTAVWRGARLSDVLNLAGGLKSSVVDVVFLASDEFSSALPPEAVLDEDALLVYEMNGDILPREHGYPARVLVPGRYGMKNPKWLAGVRALDQPYTDWYQQRGWTKDGIVKTMSRIDVPADGAQLPPGEQQAAGIAYAGTRGIRQVELSADGGASWRVAALLEPASGKDMMVRWTAMFQMGKASTSLVVRATDGTGVVQTDDFGLPAPDGGWGQDSIQVQPA